MRRVKLERLKRQDGVHGGSTGLVPLYVIIPQPASLFCITPHH